MVWRAFDGSEAAGSVRAWLMPDDRWFVRFDACRADAYSPLTAAVAANTGCNLHATVDEDDQHELASLARIGFAVGRRESHYLIPTDPLVTGLGTAELPDGIVSVKASDAYEDQLRLLDDALRQDVPGARGWSWDPGDFNDETYDSPTFDPAIYLIAVHVVSGEYVGLARIWNDPGRPRLGLVAVLPSYRRQGLARALLGQAFGVLHGRGKKVVTAEADDTNTASTTLLRSLGASRFGGTAELLKLAGTGASAAGASA
jgi:ribosomal protein S18 acetylase RimI-like enzyme